MTFAGINYLAVLVAAVAGWLVGAAWYNVLANHWLAAQGKTMEACKQEQAAMKGDPKAYLPFVLAFVANLAMAWVLAGLIGHLGHVTIRSGVFPAPSCGSDSWSRPSRSTTPSAAARGACSPSTPATGSPFWSSRAQSSARSGCDSSMRDCRVVRTRQERVP